MAKTFGRNTRKRAFCGVAPEEGLWAPTSRRLGLGAALQASGALSRTTVTLFRDRVLGGRRVGVLYTCLNMFFFCFH